MLAHLLRQQHEIAFRDLTTAKENDLSASPCLPLEEHVFVSRAAHKGATLFVILKMICQCAGGASWLPNHVLVSFLSVAGGVFVFTGSFVYK